MIKVTSILKGKGCLGSEITAAGTERWDGALPYLPLGHAGSSAQDGSRTKHHWSSAPASLPGARACLDSQFDSLASLRSVTASAALVQCDKVNSLAKAAPR